MRRSSGVAWGTLCLSAGLILCAPRAGASAALVLASSAESSRDGRLGRVTAELEATGGDSARPVLEAPGATAVFSESGALVTVGAHSFGLQAAAVGRPGNMRALDEGIARIDEGEVRTDRGRGIEEWWRALPSGLEHGVTIAERPAGEGELRVALRFDGAELVASADGIALRDTAGDSIATYTHLMVLDADGRELPARFVGATITVDDRGASYPIVVDPLVVTPEAVPLPGSAEGRFGASVAVSGDGTRALVSNSTLGIATARVFLRTGPTWSVETDLPLVSGHRCAVVALSADATRAFCGLTNVRSAGGTMVDVFTRVGTTWSFEASLAAVFPLEPGEAVGDLAISADGNRLVIGTPEEMVNPGGGLEGRVRVFSRSGTTWALEATINASDPTFLDRFGTSVAIADDGSRLLVGAKYLDAFGRRKVCGQVFMRVGTTWAEEARLVTGTTASAPSEVALSADGSSAIIADSEPGSDFIVFERTATTWARGATGRLPVSGAGTVRSLALSPDASRLLVGAPRASGCSSTPCGDDGAVFLFERTGTSWSLEHTFVAPTPGGSATEEEFGASVAISRDGRRAIIGEPAGADGPRAYAYALRGRGDPCSTGTECPGGFCVDGVCCDTACGGGSATDCQACTASAGAAVDGRCGPLTAAAAPTVTCRVSAGDCDPRETCTASSTSCPADARAPTTTVCRAPASACDAEEFCDGASIACPMNRPAIGGTVCRIAVGACDRDETCDGSSYLCAADSFQPVGMACGGTSTSCSTPGTCTGTSASCGGGTPLPSTTVCLPRDAENPCDLDDHCDGTTDFCRPTFASPDVECAPSTDETCDAPDHCSGTSADCVPEYLAGVVCRTPAGSCDVAETCNGSQATCPPDSFLADGISCRPSDEACDPEEVCDGTSASCPADIVCPPDAGDVVDVGRDDVGVAPPPPTTGCACRAARGGPSASRVTLALAGLVWVLVGRARRRR